jgi:hypothetical protein
MTDARNDKPKRGTADSRLRLRALSRWDNEGGAIPRITKVDDCRLNSNGPFVAANKEALYQE